MRSFGIANNFIFVNMTTLQTRKFALLELALLKSTNNLILVIICHQFTINLTLVIICHQFKLENFHLRNLHFWNFPRFENTSHTNIVTVNFSIVLNTTSANYSPLFLLLPEKRNQFFQTITGLHKGHKVRLKQLLSC